MPIYNEYGNIEVLARRLLAMARVSEDWLSEIVQQELDTLSQRLGSIAFAVQRQGQRAYSVLAKGDRGKGVRITVGVGDTFPFSAPAIMQAFEAWTSPADFELLVHRHGVQQFTEYTVTGLAELRGVLENVRRDGFSRSLQQYDMSQAGIAAPVFDSQGRVCMVLTSLAFSSDLRADNIVEVGTQARECALRITRRIGGLLPPSLDDTAPGSRDMAVEGSAAGGS